jgi:DNA ligase-1
MEVNAVAPPSPAQVIRWLMESPGRKNKEQIIRDAWESQCFEFFMGARLVYDKLVTFGVKKVSTHEDASGVSFPVTGGSLIWQEFYQTADKLTRRELTGGAASGAILDLIRQSTKEQWDGWYRLVLMKSLKCGITEKTINGVLKEYGDEASAFIIPTFTCQLAQDSKKHPKKMVGEKFLDVKLDGVRILTACDVESQTITMFTRNGHINTNFIHVVECFRRALPFMTESVVVDGEMVSCNFNALMKQINRKKNVDTEDAHFATFDIIPLDDFMAGRCETPQWQREENIKKFCKDHKAAFGTRVYHVPKIKVDLSTEEGQQILREFNKTALFGGYEGIMIKDPNAPYVCKKSFLWMKLKPTITVDLIATAVEKGDPDKQFAHTMGGIVFEGVEDGKFIKVTCGGGYSIEMRDEFWEAREQIPGHMGEIEADVVTMDKDGNYSLRFPRFVRWRDIEPGEKF